MVGPTVRQALLLRVVGGRLHSRCSLARSLAGRDVQQARVESDTREKVRRSLADNDAVRSDRKEERRWKFLTYTALRWVMPNLPVRPGTHCQRRLGTGSTVVMRSSISAPASVASRSPRRRLIAILQCGIRSFGRIPIPRASAYT